MLNWTDRYFRYFARRISRHSLLYTEMITCAAILHGDRHRLLDFFPEEHPLALQLGGSDPRELAECAAIGADWGYDEINLNVGCPSDRVRQGRFGACLMAEPGLVADCVAAMKQRVSLPVTVKCRIGIDRQDSFEVLQDFTGQLQRAGLDALIVHARKAWLQGLSPKENRDIPPLDYPRVHRLKQAFPDLPVVINGGLLDLQQAAAQLEHVDGAMLGRAVYHRPWLLAQVDRLLFGDPRPPPTRRQVVQEMVAFAERHCTDQGLSLHRVSRHMLGLFHGVPGAKGWRRSISEQVPRAPLNARLLLDAMQSVRHD
jgi:tRNA-dihydrouridine synthase A